jgi:hypothetical protein
MTVFSVHNTILLEKSVLFSYFNIMDIVQWNEAVKNILDCYLDRFK